ncbi:DUF4169 family protein [Aliiroseovarius lamellibrachiae]|uniref:DUF4169 family protein n=1 Tax=Aliiroseovarius lamellibrachiae TaxID=1924933 RepID=UPI001BDFB395|nr:DUF4169 family protein [Aliiroseovarius lamellibrachiae]MBT2130990.1 DUF4169 family protein [Aliiroseovarius lamellibrachiae]
MTKDGSEPVNLNRYRKEKARAEGKARAQENAVKFGRTKAQKDAEHVDAERVRKLFDGHKRDGEDDKT